MARKQTKSDVTDVIERYGKQLIVGSIVLIAVLGILSNQILKKEPSVVIPTPTIGVTPDDTPMVLSTPTPVKTKDAARGALTNQVVTPIPKLVTKLPLTAGETVLYTVKKGDNMAKLGETFCSDKRAWIAIAEDNRIYYPYTIQPGDTLKISCSH